MTINASQYVGSLSLRTKTTFSDIVFTICFCFVTRNIFNLYFSFSASKLYVAISYLGKKSLKLPGDIEILG